MARGYRQDDGLWYWATIHKVTWFFDHVIIFGQMANKKCYISNFTSPLIPYYTKHDRLVAYDMEKLVSKRKGAVNINISKPLCELARSIW